MNVDAIRKQLVEAGVDPLWDTPTTAAFLGVPEGTLDQWSYRGIGPPFSKVGRHRRYRQQDVDAWLKRNERGGGSGVPARSHSRSYSRSKSAAAARGSE